MSERGRAAATDPHRPLYHFSPDHWMNDPIPFFLDGAYHVFFQHNPHGAFWGSMHWGHAVSRDLVHWTMLPIALAPTPGGPDQDGCWTGCVVADGDTFRLLYTGIPRLGAPGTPVQQVQCLATSDDLITWEKYAGNPVIAAPPPGFGACYRDPCVWRGTDGWAMLLGSELPDDQGGAALLYRSTDLQRWEYLHPLFTGDGRRTGRDFECPDFFPLDGKHVLLTSRGRTHWHVGTYRADDQTFGADALGDIDDDSFYAAKTLVDAQGRRLLFGWLRERRPVEEQVAAGWSGVLSLPRVLSLGPDGTLAVAPAPEVRALRTNHRRFTDILLHGQGGHAGNGTLLLPGVQGDALEVLVRFAPTDASCIGVLMRCSPDLAEHTAIEYRVDTQQFGALPFKLGPGERLTLRIYVDRSVVEAFANGVVCQTVRTYPTRGDALGVGLRVQGGAALVESIDVWELHAATPMLA